MSPYHVPVVATRDEPTALLLRRLEEEGLLLSVARDLQELAEGPEDGRWDGVVVDLAACDLHQMPQAVAVCQQMRMPVLVAVSPSLLSTYDPSWRAHDFFFSPPQPGEVTTRLRHLLWRSRGERGEHLIRVGDLTIDLERYDVTCGERKVLLTFKEYQLLCLLASNPGRVFSRESLLSQIWAYDYYGGTRTVDVHIRRLRSKLETGARLYIETVWNVGYRFRPEAADSLGG